jgi:hypothetical protein
MDGCLADHANGVLARSLAAGPLIQGTPVLSVPAASLRKRAND